MRKAKKILELSFTDDVVNVYDDVIKASEATGISVVTIRKKCQKDDWDDEYYVEWNIGEEKWLVFDYRYNLLSKHITKKEVKQMYGNMITINRCFSKFKCKSFYKNRFIYKNENKENNLNFVEKINDENE